MTWLVRRLLAPFLVGSAVCIALLFVQAVPMVTRPVDLFDLKLAGLIVVPFEAIGLIMLLPIALALRHRSLSHRFYLVLLAGIGAAISIVVVMPIAEGIPSSTNLLLAMTCGAASALVWFVFNRDAAPR